MIKTSSRTPTRLPQKKMSFLISVCGCIADIFLKPKKQENEQSQDNELGTIVEQPVPITRLQTSTSKPLVSSNSNQDVLSSNTTQDQMIAFKSGQDIPSEYFEKNLEIKGEATLIMDGDTFKFFHKPSPTVVTPKANHVLKNETIKIRIAGIDTPEVSHDGKPAQPFGQESMQFLSSLIYHKQVSLKLLSKDQYGRVVAKVLVNNMDVSVEMLRNGMAYLYTGKGAEYGGKKKEMEAALNAAKASNIGIWSQSGVVESPAEYKRRTKS